MALAKIREFLSGKRMRHLLPLTVLLATPAATCGLSLAQLLLRIQAIEASQWVVVDGQGREVGSHVDSPAAANTASFLLIDAEGFKPIHVRVLEDRLDHGGIGRPLWFESPDCSGTPYLDAFGDQTGGLQTVVSELFFRPEFGFYAVFDGDEPQLRTMVTQVEPQGSPCVSQPYTGLFYEAARVDVLDQFVPPFKLVTRSALITP